MSVEWSGWFVAFLIGFVALLYNILKDVKDQIYIECYVEKEIDGLKIFSKEKESIGRYIEQIPNPKTNGYVLKFRKGVNTIFYFCPVNIQDMINTWLEKKYLFIRYLVDAYVCKVDLNVNDYYKKKLELSFSWKLLLFIKRMFWDLRISSMVIHLFVLWIFLGNILEWELIVLPISLIWVFFWNNLTGYLVRNGKYNPKRKEVEITYENHLQPIHPTEVVIDIYEVYYLERKVIQKSDGVNEIEFKPAKTQTIKEAITDKNDKIIEYKEKVVPAPVLVDGYAKLQDLIIDKNIEVIQYTIVNQKVIKKSIPQIKLEKRNFLPKFRYLWEIYRKANESVIRLQLKVKELNEQIVLIEQNKDKAVQNAMERILLENAKTGNTLKKIMQRLYIGQISDLDWKKQTNIAYKELEKEQFKEVIDLQNSQVDKLNKVIELLLNRKNEFNFGMLKELANKGNIKIEQQESEKAKI